jgi:hypothetical protein
MNYSLSVFILMLLMIPLVGAVVISLFPLLFPLFRKWSQEEYEQASRAPGWGLVVISALGLAVSYLAFKYSLTGDGIPAYIALPASQGQLLFLTDPFTVYASIILFISILAVAWITAARRAFLSVGTIPVVLTALLIFCSVSMINSASFQLSLIIFIISSLLMLTLFFIADPPGDEWRKWIPIVLLIFSAFAGIIGYSGLIQLSRGMDVRMWWQMQIFASHDRVAIALVFVAMSWVMQLIAFIRLAWGKGAVNMYTPLPAIIALTGGGLFAFTRLLSAICLQQNMPLRNGITTDTAHSLGLWSFFLTVSGIIIATLMLIRTKKGVFVYEPKGWPIGLICSGMFLSCFQAILNNPQTLSASIGTISFLFIGCAVIAAGFTLIPAVRLTDNFTRFSIFIMSAITLVLSQFSGTGNWWIISQWSGINVILPGWMNIFLAVYSTIICSFYIWKKFAMVIGIEEPGARWGILSLFTTVITTIIITISLWANPALIDAVCKSLLQTQ